MLSNGYLFIGECNGLFSLYYPHPFFISPRAERSCHSEELVHC